MRIGLVSDTHIPDVAKEVPPELMEALRGVDLILHAGDIYALPVLDKLERIAPVLCARGDDDYGDTLTDERVKEKHTLELGGKTLLLIHERWLIHETPYSPASWQNTASAWQDFDIVVFGHEHRTVVEHLNGTLLVNPGSPTFLNYLRGLGTVGILDIDSGEVDVHILQL
ncbi:YfcE family phosphodiesterase [Chloroflexota bacterium]